MNYESQKKAINFGLAISHCNVDTSSMPCCICEGTSQSIIPFDLSLHDHSGFVCRDCGEKYDPALVKVLDFLYDTEEGKKIVELEFKRGISDIAEKKAELLEHYNQSEPKDFIQFDAFACDEIYWGETTELFNAAWDIRVLIPLGTTKQAAIEFLEKIKNIIQDMDIIKVEDIAEELRNSHLKTLERLNSERQGSVISNLEKGFPPDDIPF